MLVPLLKANPNLTVLVSRAHVSFAADRLQVSAEEIGQNYRLLKCGERLDL
jgi:hypothetical protein